MHDSANESINQLYKHRINPVFFFPLQCTSNVFSFGMSRMRISLRYADPLHS